jgi:hypothetical protein
MFLAVLKLVVASVVAGSKVMFESGTGMVYVVPLASNRIDALRTNTFAGWLPNPMTCVELLNQMYWPPEMGVLLKSASILLVVPAIAIEHSDRMTKRTIALRLDGLIGNNFASMTYKKCSAENPMIQKNSMSAQLENRRSWCAGQKIMV